MKKTILETIKKHALFNPGDTVIVGLSGGADSVALLHMLLKLQAPLALGKIYAVHVNHGLRGESAAADEVFCQRLCRGLGVELRVFHANVRKLAADSSIGIEEAGRKARYQYFNQMAEEVAGAKIALGHNSCDVAETVLMNLCRGAGLRGLGGIPIQNGNVVRPMLHVSRAEINAYIKEESLPHITDASNFSPEFTRNRVRNMVIPSLEENINPQAGAIIARSAPLLKEDDDFISQAAEVAFKNSVTKKDNSYVIDLQTFEPLHMAVKRRVMRQVIQQASGLTSDVYSSHIQSMLDLIGSQTGRGINLPNSTAHREYSQIIVSPKMQTHKKSPGYSYEITPDKPIFIAEINKTFVLMSSPPNQKNPPDPNFPILHCTKATECDIVKERLFLRTKAAGDRIVLEGFTKKLQDYFVDAKIPRDKRDLIPLLATDSRVLCIVDKLGRAKNPTNGDKIFWSTLWEV